MSDADVQVARFTGYDAVRILLGLVLLTAAGLKGHQLATEPVVESSLFDSRTFLIGVVEFELFFGLWLLGGMFPRTTWLAAVACCACFAGISLQKALSGAASCGCFGRLAVNPWYTLALDLGLIAMLFRWRPARAESGGYVPGPRRLTARLSAFSASCLLVGIPAAVAMGGYEPSRLTEEGDILGNDEFVVIEPEAWVSKRLPVTRHVDIGDKLLHGTWLVLFYDHKCSACRDAVSKYEELAEEFSRAPDCPAIAIVECPPYADEANLCEDACAVRGRLRSTKRWLLPEPVAMLVDEGEVRTVFDNAREMDLLRAIWGS